MCEILAIRSEEPYRLGQLLALGERLDTWGDTGFGWGVAWVEPGEHKVHLHKQPLALIEDGSAYGAIADRYTRIAFLHLRSPSDPTTIGMPDTQPFLNPAGFAFAHNGYLPAHNDLRPRFQGRYEGRADSEIGSLVFEDLLATNEPADALRETHRRMGGDRANMIALFPDGRLFGYSSHVGNLLCTLRDVDRNVMVTSMHRLDTDLVRQLFPGAEPHVIPFGQGVTWEAAPEPAAAGTR